MTATLVGFPFPAAKGIISLGVIFLTLLADSGLPGRVLFCD